MTTQRWKIDASTRRLAELADELRLYVRARINNTRDAEDLVGHTWLAAGRTFEGRCTLRTYLYAVAKRLMCEHYRTKRRRPWVFSERDDPEGLIADVPGFDAELASHADVQRLRRAMAEVPQPYAQVLELALLGHGHLAIARALGCNYNTVRSRYNRGKQHLQRLLESDDS